MLVSFFEEYPTKENFAKLDLVTWPTKLYVAAKSRKEFENAKKWIKNKNVNEIIWWIILENDEGYWTSPFSKRSALKRVFKEAKGVPVMLDAEYPLTRKYSLFFTQAFHFFMNRNLLRKFIKNHPHVYVAEYFPEGFFVDRWMSFIGLHFDANKYNCVTMKMIYHSMLPYLKARTHHKLARAKRLYGDKYVPGFGTIATGVLGNEPILKMEQLEKDLTYAKEVGLKEVVIFRLGGLNKEYVKVIEKFV